MRRISNLAVLLVLIVLPLGSQDTSKPNSHPTNASDSQNKPKTANPNTTIINQENTYAPQNNPANQNENSAKGKHDYVFWGFIVNLILAAATFIIAVYAIVQANASKRLAKVAEQTLALAAADIHVSAASLLPVGAMSQDSCVAIKIKNYSGSRAENVRANLKVQIPGLADSIPSTTAFILAPSEVQIIRFSRFIEFMTKPVFDQIVAGTIKLRISGTVDYQDVFRNKKTLDIHEGTLDPQSGAFFFGYPADTEN